MTLLFHFFYADIRSTAIIRSKNNDSIIQLVIFLQCFHDLLYHIIYHDYKISVGSYCCFTFIFV